MLRDLTIKNYRCFKDFSIDGLARVNLIVGQNNSGKTSFLEAVYLLAAKQNPSAPFRLLHLRGEYAEVVGTAGLVEHDYPVTHLFYGHAPKSVPTIASQNAISLSANVEQLLVRIILHESKFRTEAEGGEVGIFKELLQDSKYQRSMQTLFPYQLQVQHSESIGVASFQLGEDLSLRIPAERSDQFSTPIQFITAGATDIRYLSQGWDAVAQYPERESEVIAALRLLDPSVVDIRLASNRTAGAFLVGREGATNRIPLSSLGDGMRRVLALTTAAVTSEDSVLLVDEIDTGLHHDTLASIWRLLIAVAQRLNIQIFATTHSWDCIVAFQEALAETQTGRNDLGMLFRLQQREGKIIAVDYDAEKLDVAVDHMIEVR